jgi:large subunit ribosomal protein L18
MKDATKVKRTKYLRRQRRARAKIEGTAKKPRLSVFRSLTHIYVQAIDDQKAKTLVSANDKELKGVKGTASERAAKVGELMGQKLKDKKITEAIFDKGAYKYHGRVKALADGIRKSGINF